jgi:hypothetical protein
MTASNSDTVVLSLPFTGLWLARNSPARRIPSHGSELFGERYAIDFIRVEDRGRSAAHRDWRTFLASEPPERFFGFGQPILAPASGAVVDVHYGELDHDGGWSQLALVLYMLGQRGRMREGVGAIAGNYVTMAIGGGFATLVHLKAGSLRVAVGDTVTVGQAIAECGNSGNSTQPHLHIQVADSQDLSVAQGVPMEFRDFRERRVGMKGFVTRETGIPGEGSLVTPAAGL